MTRINAGVRPDELPARFLLAEHREITRIPNAVTSGRADVNGIPRQFTLGTGHVRFFYDKLRYLFDRYTKLYTECRSRGFDVTWKGDSWDDVPDHLYNEWEETEEARDLILERIYDKG